MLRGPAGIAGVSLSDHHDSSCIPAEINKDNWPRGTKRRNFSRGRGEVGMCDWEQTRDRRREIKTSEEAEQTGGEGKKKKSLIGFQWACADSDVLKGYSIWFVIFYSESSPSLCVSGGAVWLLLSTKFDRWLNYAIGLWIQPTLLPLPAQWQTTNTPGHQ